DDGGTTTGSDDGGTSTGNDDGGTTTGSDDGGTTTGNDDGGTTTGNDDGCTTTGNDDGGTTTGSEDGGTTTGHEAEVDSFIQTYMAFLDCYDSFYTQLDETHTQQFYKSALEEELRSFFVNQNLEVDYDALVLCQADFEALTLTCDINGEATSCNAVFTGLVANGEVCQDFECATGTCQVDETGCGTCAPFAEMGESCIELQCVDGLVCDGLDVCNPLAADGEYCGIIGCSDELVCDYTLSGPLCTVALNEGDACVEGACSGELICDYSQVNAICVLPLIEGSSCTATVDEQRPC
ncbi:MAG: hypothetical protein GY822_10315, partial [Deltaproteobacteria bacterium]|nr:hypothetical protein [Deltaproteobacteria bacterium]